MVAGSNGAGKTTVTIRLRAEKWSEETERDRVGDWKSPEAVLEESAKKGIAFETVFSTAGKVDFVRRAKEAGYLVARTEDGQLRKIYGDLPEWVEDAVASLERHRDFVDVRAA